MIKVHGVNVWDTAVLGPNAKDLVRIIGSYPRVGEIYITSGSDGAHGPHSPNGSLHYRDAAIDIGFGGPTAKGAALGRDVASWLFQFRKNIDELIFRDLRDGKEFGVKSGALLDYGNATYQDHINHVHFGVFPAHTKKILAALPPPPGPPGPPPFRLPAAVRYL
jgi:hypothetical protein